MKMILKLLLPLILIVLYNSFGTYSYRNRYNIPYGCCNGTMYNRFSGLCCDNIFHPIKLTLRSWDNKFDFNERCCGSKVYHIRYELCCDGKTPQKHPNLSKFRSRCCGNQTYDVFEQKCYCTTLRKRNVTDPVNSKSDNFHCCGQEPYNVNQAMCSLGKSSWNQNSLVYSRELRTIPIPKDFKKPSICNDTIYDISKSLCCNETITEIPKGTKVPACCGTKIFDASTHFCCRANLKVIDPPQVLNGTNRMANFACCQLADQNLNLTNKFCCNSQVHDFQLGLACCGSSTFNVTTSFCCAGKVNLHKDVAPKVGCCDGTLFDPRNSVCCRNKVHANPEPGKCIQACF